MSTNKKMKGCVFFLDRVERPCYYCKHFCRHYLEDGSLIAKGHCVYPRIKYRCVYDSCEYFEEND